MRVRTYRANLPEHTRIVRFEGDSKPGSPPYSYWTSHEYFQNQWDWIKEGLNYMKFSSYREAKEYLIRRNQC